MKKICFVSLEAYLALKPTTVKYIGGAEVQQALIARYLSKNGWKVSFVTNIFDDQFCDEKLGDISIYKAFSHERKSLIPLFRKCYPQFYKLWRALYRANANIYYQRCADYLTGICALFCKIYGKKFIFAGANNSDFVPEQLQNKWIDKQLYLWGLNRSHYIISQTEDQKNLLYAHHGLHSFIINNICPEHGLTRNNGYVLWVGNMFERKRPWLLLQIARLLPEIEFVMIGGCRKNKNELYEKIKAGCPPNVRFMGYQPYDKTEAFFEGATVVVSTSSSEGFQNTYLQAWSRGIPVVCFLDPDHLIIKNELGAVVQDIHEAGAAIRRYLNCSLEKRLNMQSFCRKYFSPEQFLTKFETMLSNEKENKIF